MDFPTNFCVCAAHYFLCVAAEGTLLLTPGSYEELVAASIVPVAVTIVIVYYHLWQSWWFFWTEKIGLLLRPPQLKNPICAPVCMVSFSHAAADGLGCSCSISDMIQGLPCLHLRCFNIIWGSLSGGPSLWKRTLGLWPLQDFRPAAAPDCQWNWESTVNPTTS